MKVPSLWLRGLPCGGSRARFLSQVIYAGTKPAIGFVSPLRSSMTERTARDGVYDAAAGVIVIGLSSLRGAIR